MTYNRKFARRKFNESMQNRSKYPPPPPRNIKGAFGIKSAWNEWRNKP